MSVDKIDPQKLIFPGLAGLYQRYSDYSYAFMRFSAGAVLFPHGVQKIFFGTLAGTAAGIAKTGLPAPMAWAWAAALIEFIAAAGLALGLWTRVCAALIWIEMTTIIFYFNIDNGYFWTQRGVEYALLWWLLCIAIFFRGGGRYSIDHRLGKEF
jgi:putative oxidoreductase